MKTKEELSLWKGMLDFYVKNKGLILITLAVVVLTFGFEITNWTITIDEEKALFIDKGHHISGWFAQGRWGIAILKLLLPTYQVRPFFVSLLSAVTLSFASITLIFAFNRVFKAKNICINVITSIIFVSFPLHAFYFMFSTYSLEISIGYFLCILGTLCCFEANIYKKRRELWIGLCLLTFSIGIYQAFAQVYIEVACALVVLYSIQKNIEGKSIGVKDCFQLIGKTILYLLIALILYAIINLVLQNSTEGAVYIDDFFRWGKEDISITIKNVVSACFDWYLKSPNIVKGTEMIQIASIIVLIVLAFGLATFKNNRGIFLISMIGTMFGCFIMIVILGRYLPVRMLFAPGIYCAFSVYLFYIVFPKRQIATFATVILVLITLNQSFAINSLFFSESIRVQQDYILSIKIDSRIDELAQIDRVNFPVVFVGTPVLNEENLLKEDIFSYSYYKMGDNRIYYYLKTIGISYKMPTLEEQASGEAMAKGMPIWPAEGSVIYEDNLIIVNFGTIPIE